MQILLLPYPDLSVLCRTAALLVDGAISGGGRKYVLGTLIPNLEPIFFLGQDPADYYIAAVTFLLHSNMSELKSLDKSLTGVEGRFMGSHVFPGETISMRRAFQMNADEFNIKKAMPTEM